MKKLALSLILVAGCSSDPATTPSGSSDSGAPNNGGSCTEAIKTLMKPVDTTSTATVETLADSSGAKTVFVDGTAGGPPAAATNPRVYLNLETVTRVPVTDVSAATSTDWDLAIKRPVLFINGGQGGPGQGGAAFIAGKTFDTASAADATGATFMQETFVDAACNPQVDQTNAVKTSFDGWYEYDLSNNTLKPKAGVWIVKGATGKLYKLEFLSYYATPDGGAGAPGGNYTLRVAPL